MKYYSNWHLCRESNWGTPYDCRHVVIIEQILDGGTYFDKSTHNPEWENLLINDGEGLKSEVFKWLEENIKDRKDDEQTKGWCIGSKKQISNSLTNFDICFHRRADAMKFAKVWSKNKCFDNYFNYFKNVRKKYCPIKKRLVLDEGNK